MTNSLLNFDTITRNRWQELHQQTAPLLTTAELNRMTSLNDKISLQDVVDVYLPLVSLIQIYKKAKENLTFSKGIFLQQATTNRPFIIGVSGSVAVGKSTTSRLLQLLLARTFKGSSVELVTTDGFLYPNAILTERELLNRKGFPESYDMERLLQFLDAMQNGSTATIPVYSHEIYDIVPNEQRQITPPDFLIVEGINVFQHPHNQRLYMSDYFDFSIYIDADSQHIETWYLERFQTLLGLAKTDPTNYYHQFTKLSSQEALAFSKKIWKTINLVNLKTYIEPTRNRADIILHKSEDHHIDTIYLKK